VCANTRVASGIGRAVSSRHAARHVHVAGTMNLCPCGARGDAGASCSCTPQRLAAYHAKLSRALLDRFDLVVAVPRPRASELAAGPSERSAGVAARVAHARELLAAVPLRRSADADALLSRAVDRLPLSGRGRARVARVARTIAGLAGAEQVEPEHVAEALAYRSPRELE
jgi:magnesium chelatase family protein